jgi:hypothetical protein
MSSDSMELSEARAKYHARWEAVEIFKAHEPAAMTDERAREIIHRLHTGWKAEDFNRQRSRVASPRGKRAASA